MFRIWEIDLYIEPSDYKETGTRNALRNIIAEFEPSKSGLQKKTIWVALVTEKFYGFPWLDTSNIDVFDFSDNYDSYLMTDSYWNTYSDGSGFQLRIVQDRQY